MTSMQRDWTSASHKGTGPRYASMFGVSDGHDGKAERPGSCRTVSRSDDIIHSSSSSNECCFELSYKTFLEIT